MIRIGLVVEGKGEVEAFPLLLRRILEENQIWDIEFKRPVRLDRGKLVKEPELDRAVRLAIELNQRQGPVLVCADADDDCPAVLGPRLKAVAQRSAGDDVPVIVILANREFETWFLAGASSLCGKAGLRPSLQFVDEPESVRGAKEWLTKNMSSGRIYSPTVDQARLTALLDISAARRSASFDRCCREILRVCLQYGSR
jgi:hypothetical protein